MDVSLFKANAGQKSMIIRIRKTGDSKTAKISFHHNFHLYLTYKMIFDTNTNDVSELFLFFTKHDPYSLTASV